MISEKIRKLRKKSGLTQQELADALHIARSTLAGYETEKKEPSYDVISKLSRYFKVSTDYLLDSGLFEEKTYALISLYKFAIIDNLYKGGYISSSVKKKICECSNDDCIDFLSAFIVDLSGTTNEIHYSIKSQISKLGNELYYTLTREQLKDIQYVSFDELVKNHEQASIIDDIENLPPDEQQKIRDYISMYHKLNSTKESKVAK
ncbi:MAG: helix-turn-helix transcriptional regulator [Lachnospiraceae bacterium]|nr:helix-turn-helix transcriptional regulator [Lachnospiraceae bacterium]